MVRPLVAATPQLSIHAMRTPRVVPLVEPDSRTALRFGGNGSGSITARR